MRVTRPASGGQEIAEIEASARTTLYYDHAVIPGLLQVRDYARRVFELADVGTGDIPGKVEGRMHRQGVMRDPTQASGVSTPELHPWKARTDS